jgi:arylesterase/paraoxonase
VKSLPKPLLIAVAILLLALLAAGVEILRFAGTFRPANSRFSGSCHMVPLAGSSEDVQIDGARGLAYLSLLDRDKEGRGEAVAGTVMLLDLNLAEPSARAALMFDPPGFRPRASSVWRAPGEAAWLYVISRGMNGAHTVEVLEQSSDGGFLPRNTVRDRAFTHPNAIAAAGPGRFYVTNEGSFNALLRSGRGTLAYHDGNTTRVLVDDLAYPTGLALTADAGRLYVAEALGKRIRKYRVAAEGSLVGEGAIELDSAPGRLALDSAGSLWIAAHPKLLRLRAHLRDPDRAAPTQVLRYDPPTGQLVEIYVNDGEQISAGSVVAPWRDRFLIGALRDEKVLICKPNP